MPVLPVSGDPPSAFFVPTPLGAVELGLPVFSPGHEFGIVENFTESGGVVFSCNRRGNRQHKPLTQRR